MATIAMHTSMWMYRLGKAKPAQDLPMQTKVEEDESSSWNMGVGGNEHAGSRFGQIGQRHGEEAGDSPISSRSLRGAADYNKSKRVPRSAAIESRDSFLVTSASNASNGSNGTKGAKGANRANRAKRTNASDLALSDSQVAPGNMIEVAGAMTGKEGGV